MKTTAQIYMWHTIITIILHGNFKCFRSSMRSRRFLEGANEVSMRSERSQGLAEGIRRSKVFQRKHKGLGRDSECPNMLERNFKGFEDSQLDFENTRIFRKVPAVPRRIETIRLLFPLLQRFSIVTAIHIHYRNSNTSIPINWNSR